LTLYLGQTARDLRDSLGLTQRAAAEALGISFVHLCNVEKNRAAPSQALVDKYRELWGVDLHVLAWCKKGNTAKLPKGLRKAAAELAEVWQEHVESLVEGKELKARS
jgi:transcriptional regulator with XRE-family HTH domain